MKNVIAILFLLLSLSCQDKNEQIPGKFHPTIDWDLDNIDTININTDELKAGLEKIINLDDLRSIGILYKNQLIFEHYNIGDTTSKFPVLSLIHI